MAAFWNSRATKFTFILELVCLLASSKAYSQTTPAYGSGIGGYNLSSTADKGFAFDFNNFSDPADQMLGFDYDSSGKNDHLVLYRPGTGTVWIVKNDHGTFSPVSQSSSGIGSYNVLELHHHERS